MVWAIDVGNTHTVIGVRGTDGWSAVWRVSTSADRTEDELGAQMRQLCQASDLSFEATGVVVGSVVPAVNGSIEGLCRKWLGCEPRFVRDAAACGLRVDYDPPTALGADRIANALAAIQAFGAPAIVVDFGTATTFDAISCEAVYVGGAIMPGVRIGMQALRRHAAALPQIELLAPDRAVGKNTTESLQAGTVLGYAAAVSGLIAQIGEELGGGCRVIATGGLGERFASLCPGIEAYEPNLTLDGLLLALAGMNRAV